MDNSIREQLREQLAELEHDQWAKWAGNILPELKFYTKQHPADCTCNTCARIARWAGLMVPYSELSEEQKDQDRVWADKVIRIIEGR